MYLYSSFNILINQIYLAFFCIHFCLALEWDQELPKEHEIYFISRSNKKYCHKNSVKFKTACSRIADTQRYCWGYERNCIPGKDFQYPKCTMYHHGWSKDLNAQKKLFWEQGDFGYIQKRINTLKYICKPKTYEKNEKSFLRCSDKWEYCRGKNLFLDFSKKDFKRERYQKHFLSHGEIGGFCSTNEELKKVHVQLSGELNSWKSDLDNITGHPRDVFADETFCDIVIKEPVVFMKLDSGVNLYHHFCDYINLYASQHINGSFTRDVYLYNWDTSMMPYGEIFSETWSAFTKYQLKYLKDFVGKRVCLKDVVFSLLPRMVFGLYYNTPLVPSCEESQMFRAFSHHFLHRMSIQRYFFQEDIIRITFIKRTTRYRKILNLEELMSKLRKNGNYHVEAVDYNRNVPFKEQLEVSQHTDLLIGIHGAGLTQMLFQPDWGAVFELYNTGDADCYKDLARLRGLKYFTWEDQSKLLPEDEGHHPTLGAHEKFTNYSFDVDEFVRIVNNACSAVLQRRSYYVH